MITVTNSHTNNTNDYQIVGNCQQVISSHATAREAQIVLESTDYSRYGFGCVSVVAPGQTVSANMTKLSEETLEHLDSDPGDVFGFGDLN